MKRLFPDDGGGVDLSRPARGAWIETGWRARRAVSLAPSRPARGAWIETCRSRRNWRATSSRPARGAWIETPGLGVIKMSAFVAPRAGRVD